MRRILLIVFWISVGSQGVAATPLRVGTKVIPPFAMKSEDGSWTGISIELWRNVAKELNLEYQFEERDLKGLLAGVQDSSLDVAIAAISITPEREKLIDFSHPYYNSGLGIAVKPSGQSDWTSVFGHFLTFDMLKVFAILVMGTLFMGYLVWLFERRKNLEQFGGGMRRGLGSAFWWSAVTLTTVGYGDKTPVTLGGRLVALVWMFSAIIIVSSFTATMTTALTVSELESSVRGPEDLPKVRVGAVVGTTAEKYMRQEEIRFSAYKTPIEGLADVQRGKIDAFVYDAPVMQYWCQLKFQNQVRVLPSFFEKQYYGIALGAGSPLRKSVNQVLLAEVSSPRGREVFKKYLGE